MTRINCVPPSELSNEHLLAEYHELPRVFGLVRKAIERGERPDESFRRAPVKYTMGKGHVLFFYTKLTWLVDRYRSLVVELLIRGYKLNPLSNDELCRDIDSFKWYNNWDPDDEAIAVSRARIAERLAR